MPSPAIGLIVAHPKTPEARDARAQIENIAKRVVPIDVMLEAQIEMARTILFRAL